MTSTETQNNASQQQQMMQQQQQQQQAAQQQLAAAMFAAQSGANPNQAMQAAHAVNALDLEAKARSLLNFDYYPVKRKNFDHINDRELRKKLKNRESAQIARERAKAKMIQLERMVAELSEANRILEFENHRLKSRLCQVQGIRPNWQQSSNSAHPWSALMAHQQAQRQQAQQAMNGQSPGAGSSNSNNTFSHQANPNDPSCTQGTMTVKSEKPEQPEHEDCDGPPPAKLMALAQNISQNHQNQQNNQNNSQILSQNLTHETNPLMKLQQSTHTSSGHSSESGSHRSSSSESHDLTKINIKSEALGGENSLNLSSLTMHHLLGLTQMAQNSDKTHAFSEKDTSGAESDGKVKSMDGFTATEPDFSKIISDLKANEEKSFEKFAQFGNAGDMEGKSSDAIFKDLINSLPM